jgi:hypothetical protein
MMSDGSFVDVLAIGDGGDLRSAVLAHTGIEQIAGVVNLSTTAPAPVKAVAKKRTPRTPV